MQVIEIGQLDFVSGGAAQSEVGKEYMANVMLGAALSRTAGVAGAAFGEGIALGFGAGSWLGPLGGAIGAALGAGFAYYLLTESKGTTAR